MPPDADKLISVERYSDSGHCSRLFKFILYVITRKRSFTIGVWHKSP